MVTGAKRGRPPKTAPVPAPKLAGAESLLAEVRARIAARKLFRWRPYGHLDTLCPDGETPAGKVWARLAADGVWFPWSNKPWQFEFANSQHRISILRAGNQLGKSETAAAKFACHATGRYPDWWGGYRIEGDCLLWSTTVSAEFSRDVMQTRLFGATTWENPAFGTGFISKDLLLGKPTYRKTSVSDVIDTCFVRRLDGGIATVAFKSFEMGTRKHEGRPVHYWSLDESPDATAKQERGIFAALLARLTSTNGCGDVTMTPAPGSYEILRQLEGQPDVLMLSAGLEDVPHLSAARRKEIELSYPIHERGTRCRGDMMLGSGAIFPVDEADLRVAPFEIPSHWSRIAGIDFGSDHPTAVVWLAHDRDTDTLYVYDAHRARVGVEHKLEQTILYNAEAIRRRGDWVPVAWPHDGDRKRPDGSTWANDYRKRGIRMLHRSARLKEDKGGAQSREAVIKQVLEYMLTGRFKVFTTCWQWFEEFRMYHRDEDGLVVDRNDDTLSATFYAFMDRRKAVSAGLGSSPTRGRPSLRPMM